MLFVTVIYIPETPSFLVLKGRDEDAYRWVETWEASSQDFSNTLKKIL